VKATSLPVLRPPRPCYPGQSNIVLTFTDPSLRIDPKELGLVPATLWGSSEVTFGQLVSDFFQRKNNANTRFSHKLFNALVLGEWQPRFKELTGVSWLTDSILRVDKRTFARLLGIRSIEGSLFHQQGNFPSHGFIEIGAGDRHRYCDPDLDLSGVDFENVRLLIHPANAFHRGCTAQEIEGCRWNGAKKQEI
jgi:hypothetical protein